MSLRGSGARRLLGAALLAVLPVSALADFAAAERQYRIARRLAAQRSPEAVSALEKVVDLDPKGSLADDALIEQALLHGLPRWPEGTGRLQDEGAQAALGLLDELIRRLPQADRATEAQYHRALLRLEPLSIHDVSAARVDLTAVATTPSAWAAEARYGLAWLYERGGREDRALDAYQRLVIDGPQDRAAVRSRVGLARVLLRRGEFSRAARWLQQALDAGAEPDTRAAPLRELAVRSLLREAGAGDPNRFERMRTGIRSLSGFAPTGGGGILLGDRKQGRVVELDAAGAIVDQWGVEDLQALVVDPRGRRFVASGTGLYRLDADGRRTLIAALGDYAPVASLAADDTGGFWILERKGRRVGRIRPGAGAPQPFWEEKTGKLVGLAWDGRQLLGIDTKSRNVLAFAGDGTSRTWVGDALWKPLALTSDPAGRLAVLDGRTGNVSFIRSDGTSESGPLVPPDSEAPWAIGLGPTGELHLIHESGDWIVYR